MTALFPILIALTGIAALVAVFVAAVSGVTWLVGIGFRYVPLVGRRHRTSPLVGRQPIETESSKLGLRRL